MQEVINAVYLCKNGRKTRRCTHNGAKNSLCKLSCCRIKISGNRSLIDFRDCSLNSYICPRGKGDIGVGGSVTFCQVFWFSCVCGSVQTGKTSLPKQLLSP